MEGLRVYLKGAGDGRRTTGGREQEEGRLDGEEEVRRQREIVVESCN